MTAAALAPAFDLLPGEPFLFLRARDEKMTWAVRQLARRLHAEIDMGMRVPSLWADLVDRWRALAEKAEEWRAANPAAVAVAASGRAPVSAEQAVLDEVERLGSVHAMYVPALTAGEMEAFKEAWERAAHRSAFLPRAASWCPQAPEPWWVRLARLARRLSRRLASVGEWLLS